MPSGAIVQFLRIIHKKYKETGSSTIAWPTNSIKKICQIRHFQLIILSGCKNQLFRDEKAEFSAPLVQFDPSVPHTALIIRRVTA
jgi:hypothetical protein